MRGLSSKPPELEVFAEEGSNLRLVPQLSVVSALEGPARTKRPFNKGISGHEAKSYMSSLCYSIGTSAEGSGFREVSAACQSLPESHVTCDLGQYLHPPLRPCLPLADFRSLRHHQRSCSGLRGQTSVGLPSHQQHQPSMGHHPQHLRCHPGCRPAFRRSPHDPCLYLCRRRLHNRKAGLYILPGEHMLIIRRCTSYQTVCTPLSTVEDLFLTSRTRNAGLTASGRYTHETFRPISITHLCPGRRSP